MYESFNYTPGALVLNGKFSDAGLGAWYVAATPWNADVATPGMSYIDSSGKELSVKGNRAVTNMKEDPRTMYASIPMMGWSSTSTDGTKLNKKGATLWFSMIAQVVTTDQYSWDAWQLVDSANSNAYFRFGDLRGTESSPNTGYDKWGIQAHNKDGTSVVAMSTVNNHNSTFLLGRLSTDASTGNTTFDMWFNPLLGTEPGAPGTGTVSVVLPANADGSVTQFNRLQLLDGKWEGPSNYDEIRMDESYARVTPIKPNLSPYEIWALANASGGTPGEDNNNDGVSNGVAFFMGKDGLATNPGVENGKVTWPYVNAVASFEVQVSDNLIDWVAATSGVDTSDPTKVVYSLLPSDDPRKFCRLVVTP